MCDEIKTMNHDGEVLKVCEVREVSSDGNCLFHAICLSHRYECRVDSMTHAELRRAVAKCMKADPHRVLNGQPLSKWIEWETGCKSVEEYADKISEPGMFAGHLEIEAAANVLGVPIKTFTTVLESKELREVSTVLPVDGCVKRNSSAVLRIFFDANVQHYHALIPVEN
jgi:hypothetical protein